jgi:hypothetical protein
MKAWRRSRPFWGGLLIVSAGMELLSIPLAINALPVAILFGVAGIGYLIALTMMIAGVLVWLQPGQRVFLGLIAVLLSMASFVYSNLGGFLIGMILGLLGGMLAVAWTPVSRPASRVDTLSVRGVLIAVRRFASRTSAPRWATSDDLGRRRLRLEPIGRARAESDTRSVDGSPVAELREPTN